MLIHRITVAALVTLAAASMALADFDGPAPLAWRWVQPTNVAVRGTPLVAGDTVYVAVGQRVFALDRETGNQKWKFPMIDPIDGNFLGNPILIGDTLIASADNRKVYGVDAATGQQKWVFRSKDAILGKPAPVGKYFAIATRAGAVLVLDPTNGTPIWTDPSTNEPLPVRLLNGIQGQIIGTPESIIVMDNANEMVSIDVVTKKPAWTARFSVLDARAEPILLGDTIYVNSGQYLAAIRTSNGRAQWQIGVGSDMPVGPAISGSTVMATTEDGKALFFDLNGRPINRTPYDLGSIPMTRPAAAGSFFVLPTTDGAINLIDPTNGKILWSYIIRPLGEQFLETGSGSGGSGDAGMSAGGGRQNTKTGPERIWTVQAAGAPVVVGDTLLVLARDGSLLAFDKNSGVDLTAPRVTMRWPNPGDQMNGESLDVLFKIQDEASGVDPKSLKITVDGAPLDVTFGNDEIADARFSMASKNQPLTNGRKVFTVVVSDWMGNTAKQDFVLTIDNNLPKTVTPPKDQTGGGSGRPGRGGGGGSIGGGG